MRSHRWKLLAIALAAMGLTLAVTSSPADAATRHVTAKSTSKVSYSSSMPFAGYTATSPSPCGSAALPAQPGDITHVVWLVFENKGNKLIPFNPDSDPNLGGLALACGYGLGYATVPTKPSKQAMTSGQTWGVTTDAAQEPGPDLFSQLGTGWTSYMGGMPSACYKGKDIANVFYSRHNPARWFTDNAAACLLRDLPLPSDPTTMDLSQAFTYIEGNVPDSMHDCTTCPSTQLLRLARGDTWAPPVINAVVNSPDYVAGHTALFVVWDQASQADNLSTVIAISPYTTPGTVVTTSLNHYSLLRTTEELLGLPLLANAATATTMAGSFGLPAAASPGM